MLFCLFFSQKTLWGGEAIPKKYSSVIYDNVSPAKEKLRLDSVIFLLRPACTARNTARFDKSKQNVSIYSLWPSLPSQSVKESAKVRLACHCAASQVLFYLGWKMLGRYLLRLALQKLHLQVGCHATHEIEKAACQAAVVVSCKKLQECYFSRETQLWRMRLKRSSMSLRTLNGIGCPVSAFHWK